MNSGGQQVWNDAYVELKGRKTALFELAQLTGGRVEGDGSTLIEGVCSLENSREGHIALMTEGARFSPEGRSELPAALIVSEPRCGIDLPFLVHPNPRLAFALVLRFFNPPFSASPGIDPTAVVHETARVDSSASVGPLSVIEAGARIDAGAQVSARCYVGRNSVIGANTLLYPNVTVLHDVVIGARCIIHSGAVIGSDGFGYTPAESGNVKVPQVGRVIIGDDVEIGANTTVDRATLDATVIGDDVKIDNLVQIAHNVKIGPHTRIAAQAGLSGRVVIGANVVIGGQAGFQNGVKVGDGAMVGGQAGVIGDLEPGSKVSGYPARDHRKSMRILAAQSRLPEILDRLERLERLVSSGLSENRK